MPRVPAVTDVFDEGEGVAILGNADRVICRGVVLEDDGPPAMVRVRYTLGGREHEEKRARSQLRPLQQKARKDADERGQAAPTGDGGGRDGSATPDAGGASGDRPITARGGAEALASAERARAAGGDPAPVEDGGDPGDRARRPEDAQGEDGGGDCGSGADAAPAGELGPGAEEAPAEAPDPGARRVVAELPDAGELEAATERAARDVLEQLAAIDAKHGPTFASMHEGYAVLLEEVDELFDEVRRKDSRRSPVAMRREAIDIAVVALRIARGLDEARYGRVRDLVGLMHSSHATK